MIVDIPTFQTARLTLRAPAQEDVAPFSAFVASDRSKYVGGPGTDMNASARAWAHVTGLWVLRGYSSFTACLKDGTPIGCVGPWHPHVWPEPEMGWTLWDATYEGKGYISEALETLFPYVWNTVGLPTIVAHIHPDNAASMKVAKRFGGQVDRDAQAPDDDPVVTYRFRREAA